MRNSKFVRYSVVLWGLVVLRTKVQNGFCPMCTKGCYTVLNRSNPFWGQFWGQIGEINSYPHHSNKRAVLVPLRNADTYIKGFTQVKNPTKQYINFTLQQKVVRKYHATAAPHTAPVTARNALVWVRSHRIGNGCRLYNRIPKHPFSRCFTFARAAS